MRIIVAITGASGVIYGVKLVEELKRIDKGIEIHLIISDTAKEIISLETEYDPHDIEKMVTKAYNNNNMSATLASGSFRHDGMVIVPCSLKTLSAIANGYAGSLISRAAICSLKENMKLIIVPRETPLDRTSLLNMLKAMENGAIILPAMPAFYHRPKNISELINYIVGKILDQLNIKHDLFKRWGNDKDS